jgi:fibronectin type 3 domain-containing protein
VPTGGTGGIDTRSGEAAVISWSPNSDQDIFGYTVYRAVDANPPNLTSSPKDQPVCSTTSVSSTLCFDAPSDLQSFATNAACIDPVEQANGDKCINYYVVAFDSRWTTTTNPTTYNGTLCPGLPWSPSVDVPAPPVPASSSTAPITSSSLWGTARAGCPSAFISIDYTTHSSNQQPAAPSSLTCTTDSGQPVIGWTPPPSPDGDGDEIASYRIYRDPVGGGAPQYNDPATTIGYNLGTTNSYKDSAPTGGTGHDYWITAVDARFQESAAVHIAWTAASCP